MKLIRRRCACGCGGITNYGKKVIHGHNQPWKGKKFSEESKRKMSLSHKGIPLSEEHKRNAALSHFKCNPNRTYCDAWYDNEYRDDLRKDYCENVECRGNYKRLGNHHINLNKKDCRPSNIMTLCNSCHMTLHQKLGLDTKYQDYLTIIRKNRIIYIHKKRGQIIARIKRIIK